MVFLARTLTLNATYTLGAGDSISSESQSAKFTGSSGLSTTIAGTAPTGGLEYEVANFLGSGNKAAGIYFENTDSTNFITLLLSTGAGLGDVSTLQVNAGSLVLLHDGSDTITHIKVTADTAAATFVLSFCE